LVSALQQSLIDRFRHIVHQRELIQLVPLADGHGLYIVLSAKGTATDEPEKIALYDVHISVSGFL
jgi:hypothetical protein